MVGVVGGEVSEWRALGGGGRLCGEESGWAGVAWAVRVLGGGGEKREAPKQLVRGEVEWELE